MGVFQNFLPGCQIPPGQHRITDVHIAIQMEKSCGKPGNCRQHQSLHRRRAVNPPQKPGDQRPQAPPPPRPPEAGTPSSFPGFLVPYADGTGNGEEHPPGHKKSVNPAPHLFHASCNCAFPRYALGFPKKHLAGYIKLRRQGPADLGQTRRYPSVIGSYRPTSRKRSSQTQTKLATELPNCSRSRVTRFGASKSTSGPNISLASSAVTLSNSTVPLPSSPCKARGKSVPAPRFESPSLPVRANAAGCGPGLPRHLAPWWPNNTAPSYRPNFGPSIAPDRFFRFCYRPKAKFSWQNHRIRIDCPDFLQIFVINCRLLEGAHPAHHRAGPF